MGEEHKRRTRLRRLEIFQIPEDLVKQAPNLLEQKPRRYLKRVQMRIWRKWANQRRKWKTGNGVRVRRTEESATKAYIFFFLFPFLCQSLIKYKMSIISRRNSTMEKHILGNWTLKLQAEIRGRSFASAARDVILFSRSLTSFYILFKEFSKLVLKFSLFVILDPIVCCKIF